MVNLRRARRGRLDKGQAAVHFLEARVAVRVAVVLQRLAGMYLAESTAEMVGAAQHGVTAVLTRGAVAAQGLLLVVLLVAQEVVAAVVVVVEVHSHLVQLPGLSTPVAVAAAVTVPLPILEPGDQVLSSFGMRVRSAAQAAPSHRQEGIPTTNSPHLGHLQHEPLCTN